MSSCRGKASVSITPLVKPNAMLIVGRPENVRTVNDLIERLDQPVDPNTQFQVFHLKYASAVTAQATIQQFYRQPDAGLGNGGARDRRRPLERLDRPGESARHGRGGRPDPPPRHVHQRRGQRGPHHPVEALVRAGRGHHSACRRSAPSTGSRTSQQGGRRGARATRRRDQQPGSEPAQPAATADRPALGHAPLPYRRRQGAEAA